MARVKREIKNRTVGVSPKAPSAMVAALLAPLVARVLADLVGIDVDSEVAEGLILAVIAGLGALAGAAAAPPGDVVAVRDGPAPRRGHVTGERGTMDLLTIGAILGIAAFVLVLVILL
jgi:hypothetical protein